LFAVTIHAIVWTPLLSAVVSRPATPSAFPTPAG
jgi:hypothetical protein